ncbi:MAG: hypothetical protein FJ130_02175 [Deltaproteobacteria bacterium]|nr:hypothetical protein [Deltaproteobacteria bacterium]
MRYNHSGAEAILFPMREDVVEVNLKTPQKAITPGQATVFYDGEVVLGESEDRNLFTGRRFPIEDRPLSRPCFSSEGRGRWDRDGEGSLHHCPLQQGEGVTGRSNFFGGCRSFCSVCYLQRYNWRILPKRDH